MLKVLEVTVPIFALVFCGFFGQRKRWLPPGAVEGLNAFVFMFALPTMIFRIVASQAPSSFADWRFFAGYLGAGLLVFAIARKATLGTRSSRESAPGSGARATAFALHVTHGNVGYLGVPLAIELGRQYTPTMILAVIGDIFVIIALSIAMLELERRRAESGDSSPRGSVAATVASALIRSPLVLAIAAGLGWSLLVRSSMPAFLDSFTRILGGAAGPCALFAIGASLGDRPIRVDRTIAGLVGAKLLLHPALAAVGLWAAGCTPATVATGVLAASLPGASNSFIIARRYGVETQEISAATLVGTFVAVATVSGVIWVLGLGPA